MYFSKDADSVPTFESPGSTGAGPRHDPIDGSPPGTPIPGILQARTVEWVVISFFNA